MDNSYSNIFGQKGTIILSEVTQFTNHTFIRERANYVQLGAFHFSGLEQETLISFEELRITKSFGGLNYALIHVTNAAQMNCIKCLISDSVDYNFSETQNNFNGTNAAPIGS